MVFRIFDLEIFFYNVEKRVVIFYLLSFVVICCLFLGFCIGIFIFDLIYSFVFVYIDLFVMYFYICLFGFVVIFYF